MDLVLQYTWDIAIIGIFIFGIKQFRTPPGALTGNRLAAVALSVAFVLLLSRYSLTKAEMVVLALGAGAAGGWFWAMKINMTQIPAMVAFQNGAGGCAAMLVSFIELARATVDLGALNQFFGAVGIITGAVTFSGSMVAAGKLAGFLKSPSLTFPRHNQMLAAAGLLICFTGLWTGLLASGTMVMFSVVLLLLALSLGILFSVRVGGADMPVLISFLNATTGLAAAFCGMVVENRLLIACGALVAASGYILTYKMCQAMNRDLKNVFRGQVAPDQTVAKSGELDTHSFFSHTEPETAKLDEITLDPMDQAIQALESAQNIVIIPGYGMAMAGAQFNLAKLSTILEQSGKRVKYAIHPVAGRMPGHMNVLLAEAEIDYDKLFEMDSINPEFPSTDVALIVGACDVVNPSAIHAENTPISGMPILKAHEARQVIICNLDTRPGYSGVDNPLYKQENVILLLGNAKETLEKLTKTLETVA